VAVFYELNTLAAENFSGRGAVFGSLARVEHMSVSRMVDRAAMKFARI
jgi:hypothetical protein